LLSYLRFKRLEQRGVFLAFVYLGLFVSLIVLMIEARRVEGPVWLTPGIFWDVAIYHRAMQAVRDGLDPYAAGLARQYAAHAAGKHAFTYVYPPLTLPVLRAFNFLPVWLAALLYWGAYCASYAGLLWAVTECFRPQEKAIMKYFVPLVIFFPSLMPDEVILSGNVAYIFYGLLFAATIVGWKRGSWRWFYVVVLVASCFKVPFLTLLAIPALAGERQWMKATGVGAAGLGIFAMQALLWPLQFREYLTSVSLQFDFNADFGQSAAGNLGRGLYWHGLPYTAIPTLVFLIYGGMLFLVLCHFSKLYHQHRISAESWIPVLLVGVILLNPRIMEYDVHVVALPMVLILVRSVVARSKTGIAVTASVLILTLLDLFGVNFNYWDDVRNMFVLIAVMVIGLETLAIEARQTSSESSFVLSEVVALPQTVLAGVEAYKPDAAR
jgi:hypothetical protein